MKKLFADFLDGGKYHEPTNDTVIETESCPPNNITVERLMAKLDSHMKSAPTANIDTIENCVMFRNNDTISWLQNKDRDEQKLVIDNARKQNDLIIKKRKERQEQLKKDHQNVIHEREKNKKLKLEKKEKEKEKILEDMRKIGLWQITEINTKLQEYRLKSEKIQALKKQINIIKETETFDNSHKALFQFSCKGIAHTPEILANNLKKLLELKQQNTCISGNKESEMMRTINTNPALLVNTFIEHTWENANNQEEVWNGQIISYESGVFQVIITMTGQNLRPSMLHCIFCPLHNLLSPESNVQLEILTPVPALNFI